MRIVNIGDAHVFLVTTNRLILYGSYDGVQLSGPTTVTSGSAPVIGARGQSLPRAPTAVAAGRRRPTRGGVWDALRA